MRNLMKRRRVLGAAPSPYAAILATEPDLFVGLEYAAIGDQQVLWQDAAGTATPVTTIDDPIGCVRHPTTGAIVASQSTEAARPLWKGPGEGALFDGVDDWLSVSDFSPEGSSYLDVWSVSKSAAASQLSTMAAKYISWAASGFYLIQNAARTVANIRVGGANLVREVIHTENEALSWFVSGLSYDSVEGFFRATMNGRTSQVALTGEVQDSTAGSPAAIGALSGGGSALASQRVRVISGYLSALTSAQRSGIESEMEAIRGDLV